VTQGSFRWEETIEFNEQPGTPAKLWQCILAF